MHILLGCEACIRHIVRVDQLGDSAMPAIPLQTFKPFESQRIPGKPTR